MASSRAAPEGRAPTRRYPVNRIVIRIMSALPVREEDRGGVAAEYGVLLAGIVGVVAIAAAALGGRIGGLFDSILK